MAERERMRTPIEATGRTVAGNVARLRDRMPATELAERMSQRGRKTPALALRRIEALERRVDVDDLVALSLALGVSPVTLLMPPAADSRSDVDITAAEDVPAGRVWRWLTAAGPLDDNERLTTQEAQTFELRAVPEFVSSFRGSSEPATHELLRLATTVSAVLDHIAAVPDWDWSEPVRRAYFVTQLRRAMRNLSDQLDDLEAGLTPPRKTADGDD